MLCCDFLLVGAIVEQMVLRFDALSQIHGKRHNSGSDFIGTLGKMLEDSTTTQQ